MDPGALPPEQAGPAAWHGPHMAARSDWIGTLDPADLAELEAAMRRFLAAGDDPARIGQMTAAQFPLPRLAPRLAALRQELLHGRGFALLRRLPVERYSMVQAATLFMGLACTSGRRARRTPRGMRWATCATSGCRAPTPTCASTRRASGRPFTLRG